jgi:hypothetical protein
MARSKKQVKVKGNLLDKLDRIDSMMEKSGDYLPLLGNSSLGYPSNISAQRTNMFNKHVSQSLTLVKPEFPRVYTGAENVYGEYSAFHKHYDHKIKVERIVHKYKQLKRNKHAAVYFIRHLDTGLHDVIFRKEVEDLNTEYGFSYDNTVLDQLEEGEVVPTGTELYTSTGYDEHGNHGYGLNALTMFSFHPGTTEDAAIISESLSQRLTTDYIYTVNVQLNKDEVMLNLYGDDKHYKCLPDVGQTIKHGVLCAIRKVKMNQAFVDMRESELRRTDVLSDKKYYCEGEVIDINISVSPEDIDQNSVTEQWYGYYLDQLDYYREIYDFCKSVEASGEKMSPRMLQLKRDTSCYIDDQKKWVLPNKNILNGVYMKITVRQRLAARMGQKISG